MTVGTVQEGNVEFITPDKTDWTAALQAYLCLVRGMRNANYDIIRGRVEYDQADGGYRNLDGVVVHRVTGQKWLWDYTWRGTTKNGLDAHDLKEKRDQCKLRFTEMPNATFRGNVSYAEFSGILVAHVMYCGAVKLDRRPTTH